MQRITTLTFIMLFASGLIFAASGFFFLSDGIRRATLWQIGACLLGASGFVQILISTRNRHLVTLFQDSDAYPMGPPSHITRQLIDNPDPRISDRALYHIRFNIKFGLYIIVAAALLALTTWIH